MVGGGGIGCGGVFDWAEFTFGFEGFVFGQYIEDSLGKLPYEVRCNCSKSGPVRGSLDSL